MNLTIGFTYCVSFFSNCTVDSGSKLQEIFIPEICSPILLCCIIVYFLQPKYQYIVGLLNAT